MHVQFGCLHVHVVELLQRANTPNNVLELYRNCALNPLTYITSCTKPAGSVKPLTCYKLHQVNNLHIIS